MNTHVVPGSGRADARDEIRWRHTLLALAALTAWLFALRCLGPSNLTDNDQERPAAYVIDAFRNGHWLVQRDWTGDIASKPPLYTWISAGLSWIAGGAHRWTLYLPCALAMFGSAALVADRLRKVAGSREALLGGVLFLACPLTAKLVCTARTDALFTFFVTLTAASAHAAWSGVAISRNTGWIRTWFYAALATLTKGPLGLVLGFAGLLAGIRTRRNKTSPPLIWDRRHFAGLAMLVLLAGGWFGGAWLQAGNPLFQKLIIGELAGHALRTEGTVPGLGLAIVPGFLLSRFAPWSLAAFWALWLTLRRRDSSSPRHSLERFAAAWLVTGIVTLGLAGHQRGDLVAPLMPAAAILAAGPVAGWLQDWNVRRLLSATLGVSFLLGAGLQVHHRLSRPSVFAESRGAEHLAAAYLQTGRSPDRLAFVNTPYALQFELGTMRRVLDFGQAAELLRNDPRSAVAISNRKALMESLGTDSRRIRVIASWPSGQAPQSCIVQLDPP